MPYFDIEKLKNAWWSFSPLTYQAQSLINESYCDSTSFWNCLWHLQSSISSNPSKSSLNKHYDFYSDCVLRHPESHTAFSLIEEGGFVTSWSYKKLHRCVNHQLKKWLKQGLKSQTLVLIIINPSIDFIVALLAALRLGLTISYLPFSSPFLSQTEIISLTHQLKPDLILTKNFAPSTSIPTLSIEELGESDDDPLLDSYTYAANQTLQLSLALHRREPYIFLPLDTQTTYLQALRDGLLSLNLKPETIWTSPLKCSLRQEPWHTLTALLSGAHIMHVSDTTLIQDPLILKDKKPHIIGLSKQLLTLWSKDPGCPSKALKTFYLSPLDRSFPFFKSFLQMNDLEKTPSFQAWIDNSLGGCSLLSKPAQGPLEFYLKPSFGVSWHLKDLTAPSKVSDKGLGLFAPSDKETNYILSQPTDDCLLVSTDKPCVEGVTLPLEKIEQALNSLPFVNYSFVYPFQKPGDLGNFRLTYLIFVDPLKNDISDITKQAWSQDIQAHISQNLAPAFLPSHIEYFFLIPKKQGATVDKNWCLNQYKSGLLSKKNTTQVYQMLSILKKLTQNALTDN